MTVQKNKKRKKKRKTKQRISPALKTQIKTFFVSLGLGALAAVGFLQCLDEDHMSPLAPIEEPRPEKTADVGAAQMPDPTLVNEQALLEAEMPSKEHPPEPPPESESPESSQEPQEPATEDEEEEIEENFPLHAVAFHFHTQLRVKPEADARAIAYARRGSTFRVGEQLSRKGCKKGWHEVAPGGLYICSGQGVIISEEPVTWSPSPPPPDLEATLPYDYAYVTANNTPQYWRTPTPEEEKDVVSLFDRIEKRRNETFDKAALQKTLAMAAKMAEQEDGGPVGSPVIETPVGSPVIETPADAGTSPIARAPDGGVVDPNALPPFVHMRMARGYYVSVDNRSAGAKNAFQNTVRGRLIPADQLAPAKPSSFEGMLLGSVDSLPKVFVVGGGVKLLRQETAGGPLKKAEKVSRLDELPFLGEMKRRGRRYIQVGELTFLPSRVAAVVRKSDPPEDLKENERWIDIDLSEQTLVAYEGERPVFATLVSTGRKEFETPTGSFRVYSKHVSITMDDTEAGEEAYSIEDIPWTQYFEEGYALHTAFWHNRFGRVRSHGCINLAPADARRLFFWTGPHLPDGIHGIVANRDNPGTRIVIHE